MKLIADCHFHTVSSGHAYSTIGEYAREASKKGLLLIGMTDHGPRMPGGAHSYHFDNLKVIPSVMDHVEILKGIEANIIGYDGALDTEDIDIEGLEVVIASFHTPCLKPSGRKENTQAVINSMKNKYVNIIGHPDDGRVELDYSELVRAAADKGVMIEVNNSSLRPNSFRKNARENYKILLEECEKKGIYIIINSDSHIHTDIGNFKEALELVGEIGYPEELVANTDVRRLKERLFLRRK